MHVPLLLPTPCIIRLRCHGCSSPSLVDGHSVLPKHLLEKGWIVGGCKTVSELPNPYITSNHKTGFIFEGEGKREKKRALLDSFLPASLPFVPSSTESDTALDVEPRNYTRYTHYSQIVPGGRFTVFCHPTTLWRWGQCWWKDFWCLAEDGQRPEWTFYPRLSSNIHTYHVGKQCFFNGVFLGNRTSLSERTMDKCFGRKKYGNVFLLDLNCAMFKNTPESWFCRPGVTWLGAALRGHQVTQVQPGR